MLESIASLAASAVASTVNPVAQDVSSSPDNSAGIERNPTKAPPLTGGGLQLSSYDARMLSVRRISMEDQGRYMDLLNTFLADPANRANPQAFMQTLDGDKLDLLARVHSYGAMSTLDPATMNDEEALNFILPDSQAVDLNDDAMVAMGNGGRSFRFPPPNAPQGVKDAWEEAAASMSEIDRMTLTLGFMPLNLKLEANGAVVAIAPGDPDWKNPFSGPNVPYRDMIEKQIDGLEHSRKFNDSRTIDRFIAGLEAFGRSLTARNIA